MESCQARISNCRSPRSLVGVWAMAGEAARTADAKRTKVQRENISVLLHERLRRGGEARVPRSTLESKIRPLKIDKSRLRPRASKNLDDISSELSPLRQFARAVSLLAPPVSAPERSSCAVRRRRAQVAQAQRSDRLSEPRSSRRVSNRSDRPKPSAV